MNSRTPILAVIPCLNEARHIDKLVTGLLRDNAGLNLHIIIADGGSTDGTLAIAGNLARLHANVILLPNPKRLQSAAVNLAVAAYKGDAQYLIRLDAHADYPADYCQALIEEAQQTGADSVTVAMTTTGTSCFQRAVAAAQNSKLGNGGAAHRLNAAEGKWVDHGHHALMRIAAFRAVGGYDESFSHNEDAELDLRLIEAGYKIWLTGKTGLTYYPRSAPLPLIRQYIGFGGGRAKNMMKHRRRPHPRQLAPAFVVPALLLALFSPLALIAALPLILWAGLCLGGGIILAIRRHSFCVLLAGPAAMMMHGGWSFGFWRQLGWRR